MTGIAHVPYLEHRKPGFLYRRRIPGRLLRSTARNTGSLSPSRTTSSGFCLCVSLRTHVPANAKALASRLTALCDFAFALAMETDMQHLGDTEIRLLEHLARFEVEAHAAARALAAPRSEQAARQAAASQQATQDLLRRALDTGDCEIARDPLQAMAAQLGVALDESCDSWRVLAFEATRTRPRIAAAALTPDILPKTRNLEVAHFQSAGFSYRSATWPQSAEVTALFGRVKKQQ